MFSPEADYNGEPPKGIHIEQDSYRNGHLYLKRDNKNSKETILTEDGKKVEKSLETTQMPIKVDNSPRARVRTSP